MVLPLLTCSHYNTFSNSPTLMRLLPSFFLTCDTNTNITWSILELAGSYSNTSTSKRCNLSLAQVFHSLFAEKHPSVNKKDWKGANMPPPAEVFSSLCCYSESTPCFFVLVYSISFFWISHFCIRFFVLVLTPLKLCSLPACSPAERQRGTPIFRPWQVDFSFMNGLNIKRK